MTDVISLSKKAFTWSVVSMTILWSVGFAAFVPLVAHAETCPVLEVGDLLKTNSGSAVYILNNDLEAAYFPNSDVYKTWFEDFSGVVVLSGECFDNYDPARTGVNYMAGTNLITRVETPAVYAVLPGNLAAPIASEDVARALYGDNWASKVRDVHTFHFVNYTETDELTEAIPHDGMLVTTADSSDVYWVEDGMYKMVDGDLGPWEVFVNEVSQEVFDTLTVSGDTVTPAAIAEDPTQGAVNGSTPTGPTDPTTPVDAGELTFALAASTPDSDTVPGNAQGVEFTRFTVSGEGMLDSITVQRSGIGNRSNFQRVYLYNGNTRLGNGRSLNSDDEATFAVNMMISGTETFSVRADMAASSGNEGDENYFEIVNENDVDAEADVDGDFPIRGNKFEVGSEDIGTVTVTAQGTSTTVQIGEDEVEIGSFQLDASADDLWVSMIVLEQNGSVDTDSLSNIELRDGGTVVARGEIVNEDYIMFELDEILEIEDGDSEVLDVVADIGIADVSDTIQLILDETSDIELYSEGFEGYFADVTNTDLDSSGALILTLEGGEINVDFTGTNEDVRVDQNNVGFGVFEIMATAEDVDVDEMRFVLNKASGDKCLEDLRIRDLGGAGSYTLDEVSGTCADGDTTFAYKVENILLEQGREYEFEVTADVANNAAEGDAYYFTWAASSFDGEGDESGSTVVSGDFSSASLTGPTMTVSPSALIVRSRSLSNETVVNGTDDVLVFRGQLEASDVSDITVSSITVEDDNGTAWDDLVDSLDLYVGKGTNLIDTTERVDFDSSVSSEQAIFNGLSITVPAGSSNKVDFEIYAQIADGSGTGTFDVKVTDVDADDEDDDDVTPEDKDGVALGEVTTNRDVTVTGSGTLTLEVENNITGLKKDRWVLAGEDKALLGAIELQADNEAVKLEDLSLFVQSTSASSTVQNTFDSFGVYTDVTLTDLIATEDATSGLVTFDGVDFVTGNDETEYLYIGAVVNSIGTADDGTATASTTLSFRVSSTATTAEGEDSTSSITPTINNPSTATNDVTVAGTRVFVETSFADGTLTAGVNKTLFSFKVSADANGNTDDNGDSLSSLLQAVKLELSTDVATDASENVSNLKLCNSATGSCVSLNTVTTLNSSTQTTQLQTGTDGFVSLTSTPAFVADESNVVNDGETVTFTVKGTVSNVTDKFLQVVVTNLDEGGLIWAYDTDDDGTADFEHIDLRKDEPVGDNYPTLIGGSLNN